MSFSKGIGVGTDTASCCPVTALWDMAVNTELVSSWVVFNCDTDEEEDDDSDVVEVLPPVLEEEKVVSGPRFVREREVFSRCGFLFAGVS